VLPRSAEAARVPDLLSDLVARALDVDFDTARSADALRFLIAGIGRIYRKTELLQGDWTQTINTAVGVSTTAITGSLRIGSILNDLGFPVDEVTRDDMAMLQKQSPTRGRPEAYAISGSGDTSSNLTLTWWPTPDAIYAFTATGHFEPPTTDLELTDAAPLPSDYVDLPVAYARWKLFLLEDDDVGAARWKTEWMEGIREAATDLGRRGSSKNRRVPGAWPGGSGAPRFHRAGLF
jgi:hypothetical protein